MSSHNMNNTLNENSYILDGHTDIVEEKVSFHFSLHKYCSSQKKCLFHLRNFI